MGHDALAASAQSVRGVARDTLGFTQLKGFERTGKTRAILEDELTVLLAGRMAEELVFGDPSTGASHDLQRVTQIAYSLVASTGYSSKVGLLSLLSNEHGQRFPHMSDDTAKLIDNEVRRVVNKANEKAKKMLKKHMPKLRRMTEELLEREVLHEEDILRCFGPRPALSIAVAAHSIPASCSPNDRKSSGIRDSDKFFDGGAIDKNRIERHLSSASLLSGFSRDSLSSKQALGDVRPRRRNCKYGFAKQVAISRTTP